MPFVFIRDYSEELLELNDNLHHVLIESVKKIGGGRKVVRLRQDHRSLPLTLLNDYTEFGHFDAETEKRDILQVENEIQTISRLSQSGAIICVPLKPLTDELSYLEKLSPRVAGYVLKRLGSIGMRL